jgi:hypothetical protein
MGSTGHRIARWSLALACVAACGAVEESISTSGTLGNAETSSSGSATNPESDAGVDAATLDGETTQSSADAEDAATVDPDGGVTTNAVTTGGSDADVDTGDPSTTSTTAPVDPTTDDGAGVTTEPASACDPEVSDTACETCMKTSCCDAVEVCATNMDCWCIATCVGDGGSPFSCSEACGVAAAPPGSLELGGCAGLLCAVQCPQI